MNGASNILISTWTIRWLVCRGNVEVVLDQKDERGAKAQLLEDLELNAVLDRDVEHLSGPALLMIYKSVQSMHACRLGGLWLLAVVDRGVELSLSTPRSCSVEELGPGSAGMQPWNLLLIPECQA